MLRPQPIIATPQTVRCLGEWIDHPEAVTVAENGDYYCGGEAGQIYRISPSGHTAEVACTGGFVLGIASDGSERLHVCDLKRKQVLLIDTNGSIGVRSDGNADRKMRCPNWPCFDQFGNLYVSDSGDFWNENGNGSIWVIKPDNSAEIFHEGPFRFPNGMAIDPSGEWLYIVESTAARIVRIPLNRSGDSEETHRLPARSVPDGLAFSADGRLLIGCFRPDAIYMGYPNGDVELLIDDPTGTLLRHPTNIALTQGAIIAANLGGYHLSLIETDLNPLPLFKPKFH